MSIQLNVIKNSDPHLRERMVDHYSKPKGFVGRNICLEILCDNEYYGNIVWGSAGLHLPGRKEFFGMDSLPLEQLATNVFFNVSRVNDKYPMRNFTTEIIKTCHHVIPLLWKNKYGEDLIGFETLVEPPRTGELYLRAGWTQIGQTKGFTCKRVAGKDDTEIFTGKRVWDKVNLRPKLVLAYKL